MIRRLDRPHLMVAVALGRRHGGKLRIEAAPAHMKRAATLWFPGGRIWWRVR